MFATGQDVTVTPDEFFAEQNRLAGGFVVDLAALESNRRVAAYFGPDHVDPARRDCLTVDWPTHGPCWLNSPYSEPERACRQVCRKKRCPKRGYHLTAYRPGC